MALHKKTKRAREAAAAANAGKLGETRKADGVEVVSGVGTDAPVVSICQGTATDGLEAEGVSAEGAKLPKVEGRRSKAEGQRAKGTRKREKVKTPPAPLTPEQEAKKRVSTIGSNIKRLLRDGGKYEGVLTYQVEQTATTLLISKKLAEEIMTTAQAVEIETSREGHKRVKISPLYELYLKFDSANRHNLRALSMNRENMKTADDKLDEGDDAVLALIKKMSGEEEEQ